MPSYPTRDPETNFWIREFARQKVRVEAGTLPLSEATAIPSGSRLEAGKLVIPSSGVGPFLVGIILLPIVAFLFVSAFDYLIALSLPKKPSPADFAICACIALVVGVVFYWIRDHLNLSAYAILEIGFGVATAAQFLRPADGLIRAL